MKQYNLYYKSKLINNIPVDANVIAELRKKSTITKLDKTLGKINIPTNKIKIVECYSI